MPAGDFAAGLAFFTGTTGCVLWATILIARRRLSHLSGSALLVAYAIVATNLLVAVHLVPGLVGALARGTVLAAAAAALGLTALATRTPRERAAERDRDPAPPSGALSWAIAGSAAAFVAIVVLAHLLRDLDSPVLSSDALDFHLPDIADWIRTGTYWQVSQFVPNLASGNYPNNGNVVLLAGMLPWRDESLVRPLVVAYMALTALGVYAIAVELRAARATAVLAAATVAAMPSFAFDVVVGTIPDAIMTATFAGGVLFVLRHARTGERSDLILAGLGLGCAFGTKWFATSSVVALLIVWAAARLVARHRFGAVVRDGGVLTGLIALAGGFWLLRNAVVSGSPLFPAGVKVLGVTIFDAPRDHVRELVGFSVVHYATDFDVLRRDILETWRRSLGGPGAVAALGLAFAAWESARRRAPARVVATVAAGAVLGIVYLVTPYSAFGPEGDPAFTAYNVRYAEPWLLLAAPIAAWSITRLGSRARPVAELLAGLAVIHGLHSGFLLETWDRHTALAAGVLALAAAALLVARAQAPARWRRGAAVPAAAAAALVVVLAAVALVEREDNEGRYSATEPALTRLQALAPDDRKVGLAGYWPDGRPSPVLPAFGLRYRNTVEYAGPRPKGMLRAYGDRARFVARLGRERYDVLVVGLVKGGLPGAPQGSAYVRWAESAGYGVAERNRRLAILVPR
jgi:hypothetical protein